MSKKIIILGAGESGIGTAILAKKQGYEVFVSDKGKIKNKYKEVLLHHDLQFEEEKHTESKILEATVVMKSPGIPETVPLVLKLKKLGIPVISEIEFASQFTKAKVVGITGSNGKTTTTLLLSSILNNAIKLNKTVSSKRSIEKLSKVNTVKSSEGETDFNFVNVGTAGNIGDSFALQVAQEKHNLFVLELSSFQLDGIVKFAPNIAIITNISPDHLDRYEYKYKNYVNSKLRITKNQTSADYLIYDADDRAIRKWLEKNKVKAKLLPFTLAHQLPVDLSFLQSDNKNGKETQYSKEGAYVKDNKIIIELNQNTFTMGIANLALIGKHNVKNTMAAAMAAKLLNVRNQSIRESLTDFEGVEHRLENVLKINGVQYINDSKATNINATYYALDSMNTPTVWIVGGVDKGNDYEELLPLVNEKVKAIICLGEDNAKIMDAFSNVDFIIEAKGAEEAVKVAYKLANKGDTVLLSPACASFDLFESYEDRGRQFKAAVRQL